MNLRVTKKQITFLIERDLNPVIDKSSADKIVKSYKDRGHYKWFDHRDPELKNVPEYTIMDSLKEILKHLKDNLGYDLKRVFVKDKGKIVAFLIYGETNEKKERISDDESKKINIILSTAVDPEYRNRGLLKRMIGNSPIGYPFLVHTSYISPHNVWEKFGCKPVFDMGGGNKVEKCN